MTNEEVIAYLVKENLELKKILKEIYSDSNDINGILYCVGGGLNDNVKQYTKDQMYDLVKIADLSNNIRNLSRLEEYNED